MYIKLRENPSKEGRNGKPLIQIGLGVIQKEGISVFHKVHDWNVHDSRTFKDAISYFEEHKIKDGIVVFDRGVTSDKIQSCLKKIKWKVLCGLPSTNRLKNMLRKEIKDNKFIHFKNRVRLHSTVFYVVKKDYLIADVKGTLAICFNEQKRIDLNETLNDEIENAQMLLLSGKTIKEKLNKFFTKSGEIIYEEIRKEEELNGYCYIFTTAKLTAEEMICHYFDKDLVEKAFRSLKGIVRLRPIRHWLYNRVESHVFICYLSYLLLSILKMRLKKLNISPMTALQELDSLYRVYMKDAKKGFEVSRVVALNKMQEKILKTVDKNLFKLCSG